MQVDCSIAILGTCCGGSVTKTPDWANKRIQNAKEEDLTHLDLNGWKQEKLIEIPSEVFELRKLTYLDLGHNNLTNLPPEIGDLSNLKTILLGVHVDGKYKRPTKISKQNKRMHPTFHCPFIRFRPGQN